MVGIIIPFTAKMWRFGITKRSLQRVTNELKKAIARKKEKLCAERLDNGFESTSYTHYGVTGAKVISTIGGDSNAAFTSTHTREDGGTDINNAIYDGTTYSLPLDYAGLKAMHRTASMMVDPRGNPDVPDLNTVVVKKGSANHFKALEIKGAIAKGKIPESNDNDGAGVPDFNIVALTYLTNAGYWYAFDSSRALSEEEGFQFVESQAPQVDPVNVVYKTKEIQTSATTWFDLGHNDVTRCWVGSRGDSAAVS